MVELSFNGIQYDDDDDEEDEDEDDYGIMFQFLTALTVLSKMTLKKKGKRRTEKQTDRQSYREGERVFKELSTL